MYKDQKKDILSTMERCWKGILSDIKGGDRESVERQVRYLVERNRWQPKEVYGCLLVIAAIHGEIEAAEFCKDRGADLDYEDYGGGTPLWIAKSCKQDKMAEVLKGWGARKDTHDTWGGPSTNFIIPKESFIQEKPSIGIVRKMALYWEEIFSDIKKGERESAERQAQGLIERNRWEPKEAYGYLLLIAANHGEIEAAEFCKDKGADLDYRDHLGRTPLGAAQNFKQDKMAEILKGWVAREGTRYGWARPSSSLESHGCSGQEKQKGHAKKASCNLM